MSKTYLKEAGPAAPVAKDLAGVRQTVTGGRLVTALDGPGPDDPVPDGPVLDSPGLDSTAVDNR